MKTQLKAIAAMANNRAIGRGNSLPWHLPEDFRWFKSRTLGQVLLMGRKTFQSIGRPLPGRTTLVLSRGGFSHPGVLTIASLAEIERVDPHLEIFVCGGADVYSQLLPRCSDLYLTRVKRQVEGDAFFPPFEPSFSLAASLQTTAEFEIEHWVRNSP